jgi:endonuclease VIII
MPEGDSLVRLADRLRPVLEGQRLVRTDFRVPQLATLDLSGRTVRAVWPRAKYLVVEADDLAVLSHLKMEGRWETYPLLDAGGQRIRPRWRHPGWQARAVLETEGHEVVGFQLGLLEVLPTTGIAERLGFLGPDVLDHGWTDADRAEALMAESTRRLLADPERPIGLALLDQRLVSGIGNIYRCEVLLLAGMDPHRPVGSIPDLPGLVLLARELMLANTAPEPAAGQVPGARAPGGRGRGTRAGAPGRRATTAVRPDPEAPYGVRVLPVGHRTASTPRQSAAGSAAVPAYWVYGHRREGCLRCGGTVAVETLGNTESDERILYWCPRCQR